MASPPSLREMLEALAGCEDPLAVGNALGVYQEVVKDLGPETALYQGLIEAEIMSDIDVEIAVAENRPIHLVGETSPTPEEFEAKNPLLDILECTAIQCSHLQWLKDSKWANHCTEASCPNDILRCPTHKGETDG